MNAQKASVPPQHYNNWPLKLCTSIRHRTRAEAQAAGRQSHLPSVAGPQPVPAGHDQQHPGQRRGPVRDVQHHHEAQTQGEQLQGSCSGARDPGGLALCLQTLSCGSAGRRSEWCITHITPSGGVVAVRLGPGQREIASHSRPFKHHPWRETLLTGYSSDVCLPHPPSPCGIQQTSHLSSAWTLGCCLCIINLSLGVFYAKPRLSLSRHRVVTMCLFKTWKLLTFDGCVIGQILRSLLFAHI